MKYIYKITLLISIILLSGCSTNKDALRFKKDYESMNNMSYRKVIINKKNAIKYSSFKEVNNKIKNGDTFILYIASKSCPWSRSSVEYLINESNSYGIRTIYYIDIRPNDINSDLRDIYEYKDNNKKNIFLSHKGTNDYSEFLKLANNVLNTYSYNNVNLNNTKYKNIKMVDTPSLYMIKKGKIKTKIIGVSEKQKNENQKITEEIKNDMIKIYDDFFEKYTKI